MILRPLLLSLLLLSASLSTAQMLVINELDCDTPGIDDLEFVELKSAAPFTALDGYVLVFSTARRLAETRAIWPSIWMATSPTSTACCSSAARRCFLPSIPHPRQCDPERSRCGSDL
ncbi:MAG: hypothetical protein IPJ40_03150 [Saprospirales bacterium]|nr:hypothetical protein [Saprospirales bacterium]